ncbi:MAG: hypothetical protein JW789_03915 [Candidatus Aenigmarchaeota archaeon]|nr:hypothetical protein [Candidatus Aenigmarchaeota archaeon]
MVRKGISPVVAVVILIAIAVMIGGMVSSWVSSFVTDNTAHDDCGIKTLYSLSDATINETSGEIKLKLKNIGSLPVYGFSIEVDNGTTFGVFEATYPDANYTVSPGETQYIITNTTYNITNVEKLTVKTVACSGYAPTHANIVNL